MQQRKPARISPRTERDRRLPWHAQLSMSRAAAAAGIPRGSSIGLVDRAVEPVPVLAGDTRAPRGPLTRRALADTKIDQAMVPWCIVYLFRRSAEIADEVAARSSHDVDKPVTGRCQPSHDDTIGRAISIVVAGVVHITILMRL